MDLGNDSYTNSSQVAAYLDKTLDTNLLNYLDTYITWAVSRWIDRALGTNFDNLPTGVAFNVNNPNNTACGWKQLHFRGGVREINIRPCQQILLVQAINPYDFSVWYTYSTPLEYTAEPYDPVVKNSLIMKANEFTGPTLAWPPGENSIMVTALFTEYDYVNNCYPKDIVMLANHVCAVWLQDNQNTEVWTKESIEGYSVQKNLDNLFDLLATDPMLTRILDSREEIWLDDM